MELAEGMAEAIAAAERFTSDDKAAAFWAEGAADVHAVEELTYPGAVDQPQRLRLYRCGPGTAPVLVYIHGGGWVGGSIDLNERAARHMTRAGCHVANISYRLAPDHPFPAGLEDCLAAVNWLKGGAVSGLDPSRIAIGGASAGANLAVLAATCLPRNTFRALVLFYGVYGNSTDTPSHQAFADGPGLTRARVAEILDLYDPGAWNRDDPRLAPLLADLTGLPPVFNLAAGIDVLLSDNEAMARHLTAAGVDVTALTIPGVTHGFINRGRLVPAADAALDTAARWLASHI